MSIHLPTINRALDLYERKREDPNVDSVAALVVNAVAETALKLAEEVWEYWEEDERELDLGRFTEAVGRTIVASAAVDVEEIREQRARARREEHHASTALLSRTRRVVDQMLAGVETPL